MRQVGLVSFIRGNETTNQAIYNWRSDRAVENGMITSIVSD